MVEFVGFIGDSYLVPSGTSVNYSSPRTMTMLFFTAAGDPYNDPTNISIQSALSFKNGNITTYEITDSYVEYSDPNITAFASDGTTDIYLYQYYAAEFALIEGTIIPQATLNPPNPMTLLEKKARDLSIVITLPMNTFNIAEYANSSAFFFPELTSILNLTDMDGFAVIFDSSDVSTYTIHNMTNVAIDGLSYTGLLDGVEFSSFYGAFYSDVVGVGFFEQFDSLDGIRKWFETSATCNAWLFTLIGIAVFIIIVVIILWATGVFSHPKM